MTLIFFLIILLLCFPTFVTVMVVPCYMTTQNKREAIFYSAVLAIFYAVVGYCFKDPKTDPDIVRYIQMLQLYRGKSLVESFNLVYDNLFSVDIWFYILSRFKDNQLLPATSLFVFYFISFYVLSDYRIRKGISNTRFISYAIFTILAINLGCVLNAFRSNIAFIVFFLAIYRELIQNKKNIVTYLLYVFSFFMHFAVLALITLRIILLIKNKKLLVGSSILIVFMPKILEIIGNITVNLSTGNAALDQVIYFINRANMYFRWSEGGWADKVRNSGYYKVERAYYLAIVLFIVYVSYISYKKAKRKFMIEISMLERYQIFGIMYLAMTLITFLITAPEYNRFVTPFLPFASVILFDSWSDGDDILPSWIHIFLIMMGGCGIVTNCYFLNSFISIPNYIIDILTFSPLL